MNKRNQAEHGGGRTSIRSPLQLLLLSLFLCFLPYPGATASTSPTSATLRRSPTSTTTTTSTSGNKTKTSNTNTLNTQALNISTSTSTFNPSALQATRPSVSTSTSGNKTKARNTNTLNSQALNTSTSTFNPSALQATRPSVSNSTSGIMAKNTDTNTLSARALHISTVSISGIQKGPTTSTTSTIISRGRTRTRIRRATTKRQICPPPEEDVGSQGGPRAGRRKVASGSPVPAMKECAENQLGLVVEAGATEACRINVLDTYECDPRQAVMVLVTLDETLHSNGSVQAHQVGEGGAVEVYLKEEQPGSYRLYCIDNLTSESLVKVFVGFEVLDVEEFECRIQSVNELDCVWTLPYNPAQNDNDYRPYVCVDQESKLCDCIDGSCGTEGDECMKECCSWDVRALPNMTDAAVSMVFWATNPLMNDYTYFRHSFDPLAVVVPEAPQEVEAAVSGLGVMVTWRTPAAFLAFPPCLTFLLDHRDAACPACAWTTDATGTCCAPECRSAARLEHWWRRYEVRVRLRSAAAPQPVEGDGWWSDWQPRYVNTSAAGV
ncbi:uncharacterized protein LOC126999453 [Eriocheir sinensis]|uniref:uncharacterized protein LOC126999453 n=1 Tax=Eriocheir sinensis TaxID=95602 RepID=UPI0021C66532|nr:uncharacterized protein LOC126999453 [Eriocheir sinensis]